jgi:hypothetical protein
MTADTFVKIISRLASVLHRVLCTARCHHVRHISFSSCADLERLSTSHFFFGDAQKRTNLAVMAYSDYHNVYKIHVLFLEIMQMSVMALCGAWKLVSSILALVYRRLNSFNRSY